MLFPHLLVFLLSALDVYSTPLDLSQVCGDAYQMCLPTGATTSMLPPVGSKLSGLYPDLIAAVNQEGPARSGAVVEAGQIAKVKRDNDIFCCARNSVCMLLDDYDIAFCWDRFTTDFYFPDGSYGSLVLGNFTSASGTQVNLIYGEWQDQNGTKGNIYSDQPSMMPDTSTMLMPTPWTSGGVGSAIPASVLGSSTVMSGTSTQPLMTITSTISAITLPSTTISIGTSDCGHCNFTIIPGLTGLPSVTPITTVLTSETTYPVTTITVNSTSMPSASSTIYSATIIIPPIMNDGVLPVMIPSYSKVLVFLVSVIMSVTSV